MIPSGWQPDDTIAALASPPGAAARGLIRLSGHGCREVLETCFSAAQPEQWRTARQATRFTGTLQLAGISRQIPAAVCLWPGRRSYTGEPAAELHLPGSPPLLEAVLSQLHTAGARPARPGEYTLRAFLAGRIDLVQAEAVLGVIDAADESELQQALRQLAGGLSAPVTELRSRLLNLLADLEAGLDFVEEDIENILSACKVKPMVNQILAHISNTPSDLIRYCQDNDILVEAYSPVGHGELLKNQQIAEMAASYGVSIPQLGIRYDLQLGLLPLPKTANPEHMKINAAVDFVISDADMKTLKNMDRIKDYGAASHFPVYAG